MSRPKAVASHCDTVAWAGTTGGAKLELQEARGKRKRKRRREDNWTD